MQLPDWILLTSAIVGHVVLWVMLFNRMHSTGLPCALLKALNKILGTIFLATLVGIFVVGRRRRLSDISWDTAVDWLVLCYWIICCLAGVWVVLHWVRRRLSLRRGPV